MTPWHCLLQRKLRVSLFLCVLLLSPLLSNCGGAGNQGGTGGGPNPGPDPGPPPPSPAINFFLAGNTQSSQFPVTNGSLYISGGDFDDGIFSVLSRGSGATSLAFSTYLGGVAGAGGTQLRAIWSDPVSGDIFIGGRTGNAGVSFPVTAGVFQPSYAGGPDDAVICRYTAAGKEKWCSYLGTNGPETEETVYAVAGLDPNGNLAVCGRMNYIANGTLFDGVKAVRIGPAETGDQAYVAKIKPDGSALVWYTGFGGSIADGNRGRCILDSQGNVYGEGDTESIDFPATAGAFQTVNRDTGPHHQNGMVYEMAADGSHLVWSSYIGGTSGSSDVGDIAEGGLALDADGNLYVAGSTPGSANFFVNGNATGYQKTLPAGQGLGACIVAYIKGDGSQILHSTFLGGATGGFSLPGNELDTECDAIALDSSGNVVVEGFTSYSDFPTTAGAYQTKKPGVGSNATNGFVTKLSADLSTLVASTYIGGSGNEFMDNSSDIAFDANGEIFSMLSSYSPNFPATPDALFPSYIGQGNDIVVFGLSPDLKTLVYGTYFGGPTAIGETTVSAGNWPWAMALTIGPTPQ